MPHINDAISEVVGPGQLNDRLLAYYNNNRGGEPPSPDLNDAEASFLTFQGGIKSQLNDMWFNMLRNAPYSFTGALGDMKFEFWVGGGVAAVENLGPELVANGDFSAFTDWVTGAGWSILIPPEVADSTGNNAADMRQLDVAAATDGNHRVTFDILAGSTFAGNGLRVHIGAGFNVFFNTIGAQSAILTEGILNDDLIFDMQNFSDFIGQIDNVSVREIL